MKVYVVLTKSKITGNSKVSQEGYSTLEAAQKFISYRTEDKEWNDEWTYETKYWIYEIVEVSIQ